MAKVIPKKLEARSQRGFLTGRQIIDIVTNGMYSNPLMVLREYIQNAADSIDNGIKKGILKPEDGHIDIFLDGDERKITIYDNGTGVEDSSAINVLASLGISTKLFGDSRGFRGVGRLSGVGYSDRVQFETRSSGTDIVHIVVWDCNRLRSGLRYPSISKDIASLLKASISVSTRKPRIEEEQHFFRVSMFNVQRFHRDELLNLQIVANYLSQVVPAPYDSRIFPFAGDVEQHLSQLASHNSYNIALNGNKILKPYRSSFYPSKNIEDFITGIETFQLKGVEGDIIGAGWFAKTQYLASLSLNTLMRGIRVRQGNIEVGDEYFLESAYAERRFATWHIGEVELTYKLKLNARRDGFEQTPNYEAFLEQMASLGRYLSRLCRTSSKERSSAVSIDRRLNDLEDLLRTRFALDKAHLDAMRMAAEHLLGGLDKANGRISKVPGFKERYEQAKRTFSSFPATTPFLLDALDGRALRYKTQKALLIDIAASLFEQGKKSAPREKIMDAVFLPYLRKSVASSSKKRIFRIESTI